MMSALRSAERDMLSSRFGRGLPGGIVRVSRLVARSIGGARAAVNGLQRRVEKPKDPVWSDAAVFAGEDDQVSTGAVDDGAGSLDAAQSERVEVPAVGAQALADEQALDQRLVRARVAQLVGFE